MKHPKVPSVGADEDAAKIFRAAKKSIQPANRISSNKIIKKKKKMPLGNLVTRDFGQFWLGVDGVNTECHTVQNLAELNMVKCFHCLHAFQSAAATAVLILGFMLLGYIEESSKDYKGKINDYSDDCNNGWSGSRSDAYNVDYSNGHSNTSKTVEILVSASKGGL